MTKTSIRVCLAPASMAGGDVALVRVRANPGRGGEFITHLVMLTAQETIALAEELIALAKAANERHAWATPEERRAAMEAQYESLEKAIEELQAAS
ncbi:MAG: hypothetical protein FD149_2470 [Rhodospirillaceae bacterium]|nr:MAG: hypothetical protein FD149_2470 [Rhodospirillaceae bacterium]